MGIYIDEEFLEQFTSEGFREYKKVYPKAEAIPMMELMGNEKLFGEFHGEPDAVYDYCLENHKTWEEVLGYKYDPNVMY